MGRDSGPRLLESARSNGCRPFSGWAFDILNQDLCQPLILLASRMPVPENFSSFYDEIGITQFIEDNHASIVSYLSPGVARDHDYIPFYGTFASMWTERFANSLTNSTFAAKVALNNRLTEYRFRNIGERWIHTVPDLERVSFTLDDSDDRDSWLESYAYLNSLPAEVIRRGILEVSMPDVYIRDETVFFTRFRNEWFYNIRNAITSSAGQRGEGADLFERRRGTEYHQIVLNEATRGREDRLNQFRIVGRVFALSIIHGIPLGLNLPVAFYKRLLGYESSITLEDVRGLLANEEFIRIRYIMDSERTEEELAAEAAPLVGSESSENVSLANRDEQFAAMLENVSLSYSPEEFDAIADGLLEIIPRSVFGSVRPEHVAEMISGVSQVDVEDMVNHFYYNQLDYPGAPCYSRRSNQIIWLTAVLNRFDQPLLRKFLRVYTGSDVIPVGGFSRYRIRVTGISRNDNRANLYLPTYQIGFRSITLPAYESEAELEQMLRRSLMSPRSS